MQPCSDKVIPPCATWC